MRAITMPSEEELPDGPWRRFLIEVFQMYRAAGRPVLRDIVAQAKRMDLPGTASQETIRRVLKGKVLPQRWETAYAIYAPLCALAGVDPEALYWDGEGNGYSDPDQITHKQLLKELWSAAFDAPDVPPPFLRSKVPPPSPPSDPWAKVAPNDLDDEPPF